MGFIRKMLEKIKIHAGPAKRKSDVPVISGVFNLNFPTSRFIFGLYQQETL